MTRDQANAILARVRAGDKTPSLQQINEALTLTGDLLGAQQQ